MAPSEFSVRLQKGGFAPPTPSAVYTLNKESSSNDIDIETMVRPEGTPELQQSPQKTVPMNQNEGLIKELYDILRNLPTETPPGSEDIYGLDIGITWGSEDLMWNNGGPSGCSSGGSSSTQATAQNKTKFKRAVDIIEQIAK